MRADDFAQAVAIYRTVLDGKSDHTRERWHYVRCLGAPLDIGTRLPWPPKEDRYPPVIVPYRTMRCDIARRIGDRRYVALQDDEEIARAAGTIAGAHLLDRAPRLRWACRNRGPRDLRG